MVQLNKQDWVEIYYALVDKRHDIVAGKYQVKSADADIMRDEREECGVWADQLERIILTIGPDGGLAAQHGVEPGLPTDPTFDCGERPDDGA